MEYIFSIILFLFIILCAMRPVQIDKIVCCWQFRKLLILIPLIVAIPFLMALLARVMGISGSELSGADSSSTHNSIDHFWAIAHSFISMEIGNPTTFRARFLSTFVAMLGAMFMSGLLISVLTNIFDKHIEDWQNGDIRYKWGFKRHTVIIGGNELLVPVITHSAKHSNQILVQTKTDVSHIRNVIRLGADNKSENKVTIYHGGRCEEEELQDLLLHKATDVYIIGESTSGAAPETHHDSYNMICAERIAQMLSRVTQKKRLPCHVLFDYQSTFSAFQFSDLPRIIKDNIEFMPFNVYENWAHKVIVENHTPSTSYQPLDGQGIRSTDANHVHLVIVGMSDMGLAFAVQAAQVCHFPNYHTKGVRTRITLIDSNAQNCMEQFMGRYQYLFQLSRHRFTDFSSDAPWIVPETEASAHIGGDFMDIEWEFIQSNIESPQVKQYLRQAAIEADKARSGHSWLTVAVCLPEAHNAVSASLYMPQEVYKHALQVLVYQTQEPSIIRNLTKQTSTNVAPEDMYYHCIRPFGMDAESLNTDADYVEMAKIINAQYSGVKDLNDKAAVEECWTPLDVALKWSSRYNADSIGYKLRSVGATHTDSPEDILRKLDENMDELMILEHNRWNTEKLLMSFRPITKQELVHLESLTPEERSKEKKRMKQVEKIHPNICSFDVLLTTDPGTIQYDIDLTRIAYNIILKKNKQLI